MQDSQNSAPKGHNKVLPSSDSVSPPADEQEAKYTYKATKFKSPEKLRRGVLNIIGKSTMERLKEAARSMEGVDAYQMCAFASFMDKIPSLQNSELSAIL